MPDDKKFIQSAIKKPGALRKELKIKKGEKIPSSLIAKKISALRKKSEGDKKLSGGERTELRRLVLAKTLKGFSKGRKKSLLKKEPQ